MEKQFEIRRYEGDIVDLYEFVMISAFFKTPEAARRLLSFEVPKGTVYFVAYEEEVQAGAIGIYVDEDLEVRSLEPAQVIDLAVKPEFRRRGLAKLLMDSAEEYARSKGCDRIWLFTGGENVPAMTSYEKMGFEVCGSIPEYWGKGTTKAFLSKNLA